MEAERSPCRWAKNLGACGTAYFEVISKANETDSVASRWPLVGPGVCEAMLKSCLVLWPDGLGAPVLSDSGISLSFVC